MVEESSGVEALRGRWRDEFEDETSLRSGRKEERGSETD